MVLQLLQANRLAEVIFYFHFRFFFHLARDVASSVSRMTLVACNIALWQDIMPVQKDLFEKSTHE